MVLLLAILSLDVSAAGNDGAQSRLSIGFQAAMSKDLPDRVENSESASFRIGSSLVVPARIALLDGLLLLRAGLETQLAAGSDRVTWSADGTSFYKQDQPARVWSTHLLLGPEVRVPTGAGSPVHPYLGVGIGPGRVRTTQIFDLDSADLLDPSLTADSPDSAFLARSSQWVLAASADGGLAIDLGPVAAELEAGYTVSFVPEALVSNTDSALKVQHAAYGLDIFRLGLGLSVPF